MFFKMAPVEESDEISTTPRSLAQQLLSRSLFWKAYQSYQASVHELAR
jgi:hypothetical protein